MKTFPLAAILLAGSALAPIPALAQAVDGADANGEIIVTATRSSQSVLKVPVSVTAVSADTLKERGANDIREMSKLAPSLQAGQGDTFSVRGVGTNAFFGTVESSVSQAIDEVVIGTRHLSSNGFFDLERIEVLNGPQGLLFGKNSSAGLVSITTANPRIGVFGSKFDVEGTLRSRPGDDGQGVRANVALNVPVSANSAFRLAATYSKQDSITRVIPNTASRNEIDVRQFGVRAKFLLDSGPLSILLTGDYFDSKGGSGEQDITYRSLGTGSQYAASLAAAGITPGPENLTVAYNAPVWRDRTSGGLQAKVSYEFDSGYALTNIASWKTYDLSFQYDSDQSPISGFDNNNNVSTYNQYSNELRLTLPGDSKLTGQFGLFYFRSDIKSDELRAGDAGFPSFLLPNFPFCVRGTAVPGAFPPTCSVRNDYFIGQDVHYTSTSTSYAGFGQLSYALSDTLKLTAGGRVTRDELAIDFRQNLLKYFTVLGASASAPTAASNVRIIEKTNNTNFSWKLGADWQATPDTLIYGFYGHGYKGPGFNNSATSNATRLAVKPEISRGGEIGIKSALLDRKLTVMASAFYTKFDDIQINGFDAGIQSVTLTNAAKATTKGFELSLVARPVTGLTLSAIGTYTDATFDSYPGRACYFQQATPSCAVSSTYDAKGEPLPLSAKFASYLSADYETPISDTLNAAFSLGYRHRSKFIVGNAPQQQIPQLDTLDASLGVKGENWNFSLFCRNCTNQIRPVSIDAEPGDIALRNTLSFTQRWGYDSVRSIGARLGFDF